VLAHTHASCAASVWNQPPVCCCSSIAPQSFSEPETVITLRANTGQLKGCKLVQRVWVVRYRITTEFQFKFTLSSIVEPCQLGPDFTRAALQATATSARTPVRRGKQTLVTSSMYSTIELGGLVHHHGCTTFTDALQRRCSCPEHQSIIECFLKSKCSCSLASYIESCNAG
jgi:hypothetical protein